MTTDDRTALARERIRQHASAIEQEAMAGGCEDWAIGFLQGLADRLEFDRLRRRMEATLATPEQRAALDALARLPVEQLDTDDGRAFLKIAGFLG